MPEFREREGQTGEAQRISRAMRLLRMIGTVVTDIYHYAFKSIAHTELPCKPCAASDYRVSVQVHQRYPI